MDICMLCDKDESEKIIGSVNDFDLKHVLICLSAYRPLNILLLVWTGQFNLASIIIPRNCVEVTLLMVSFGKLKLMVSSVGLGYFVESNIKFVFV